MPEGEGEGEGEGEVGGNLVGAKAAVPLPKFLLLLRPSSSTPSSPPPPPPNRLPLLLLECGAALAGSNFNALAPNIFLKSSGSDE